MNVRSIITDHYMNFGRMGTIAPIPYGWSLPSDMFKPCLKHITERVMDEFLKRHSIKRYISVLDQVAETRPNAIYSNASTIMYSADWIGLTVAYDSLSTGFMYFN